MAMNKVTLIGADILVQPETNAKVSMISPEVLMQPITNAKVTLVHVEVLRSLESAADENRRKMPFHIN